MSIKIKQQGDLTRTTKFLNHLVRNDYWNFLDKCGQEGVSRLKEYTPKDTGKTSESWSYEIIEDTKKGTISLIFTNSNVVDDWCNIAIMIQNGHATRDGKWVEGIDYINPALDPIFNKILEVVDRNI